MSNVDMKSRKPQQGRSDPTLRLSGFNIPRKVSVRLKLIRTGHGIWAHFLYLWYSESLLLRLINLKNV